MEEISVSISRAGGFVLWSVPEGLLGFHMKAGIPNSSLHLATLAWRKIQMNFQSRTSRYPEPFQLSCEMWGVSVHECCCLMYFNLLYFFICNGLLETFPFFSFPGGSYSLCAFCAILLKGFLELAWSVGRVEMVSGQGLQAKVSMCIRKHPWPKILPVLQMAQGWRHSFFVLQGKFWPSRGKWAVALLRNTWSKATIQMGMCSDFL